MSTAAYRNLPDETKADMIEYYESLVLLQPLATAPKDAPLGEPKPSTSGKSVETPAAEPTSEAPTTSAKETPAKKSKEAVTGSGFSFKWAFSAGAIGGFACAYFFAAPLAIVGTVLLCFFGAGAAGASDSLTPVKAKKEPKKEAPVAAAEKAPKKPLAKRLGATRLGRFLQKSLVLTATAAMGMANYLDPNHEAAPQAPRKSMRQRISDSLGSPKMKKLGTAAKGLLGRGAYIGLGAIGVLAYQHCNKAQVPTLQESTPIVATAKGTPTPKTEAPTPAAKPAAEAPVQIEGLAVTDSPKVQEHSNILLAGTPLITLSPDQSWQDLSAPITLAPFKPLDFQIEPMVKLNIPAAPEVPQIPVVAPEETPEEALGIPALIEDDFSDVDFSDEEPASAEASDAPEPTAPEAAATTDSEAPKAPEVKEATAPQVPAEAPAPKVRNADSLPAPTSTLLDNVVAPGVDQSQPQTGAITLNKRPSTSVTGTVRGALHSTRTFMTGDPDSHAGALGTVGTGADRLVVGTCRTTGHALRYVGRAFWHGVRAAGEAVSNADATPTPPTAGHK